MKLTPKALEVLWLLARQAGNVVTRTALLDAVWPETVVSEDALAFQIQALRQALGDDARKPRYIATRHRVGFCFVAPVTVAARRSSLPELAPAGVPANARFVGREAELARLRQQHAKALRGDRQLVFVTGEAGVGKTTLLELFLSELSPAPLVGRGQCVEQHGPGEGYLPVLEALTRLCREPEGERVIDGLRRTAPTWLLQMPELLTPDEAAALQLRTAGATHERMLREVADALQTLAAERPLILVLEDLHWSDPSTIEMLALLARRREPARLLVFGTYRPADLVGSAHPLQAAKRELVAREQAAEIALGNLAPADVHAYVARRFPDVGDESRLSAFVYRRTEGHPLFMVQVADYLAQRGAQTEIAPGAPESPETAVPHGLRELIEVQIGRLTESERQVLEIASVAGVEFTVASLSAGGRIPAEDAETRCEELARQGQFVEDRGLATWPDGTVSGRYGFRHSLYQGVLYDRLSAHRRARAHLAIGTREEAGYGERSAEIAAELAVHFERGHDHPRAVHHHLHAGERALQRSANAEAIAHFSKGLDLLRTLPETPERARYELRLHVGSSLALTMTKGYSAVEVERVSARALELCQQMEETPEISSALFRIARFYLVRGEIRTAREVGERLLRIARSADDPALLSRAHTGAAFECFSLGDFSAAQAHAEQAIAPYDLRRYRALGVVSADDGVGVSLVVRAFALQVRGHPDQAEAALQEGVAAARELSLPFALGGALLSTADLHLLRRESRAVREAADVTIDLAAREGFPYYVARATILRGWALADQGEVEAGITEIRRGLAAYDAMGARLWLPCCLGLLAEALGKAGEVDEALGVSAEALETAVRTGEREYEAELHRLRGELTLRKAPARRKSQAGSTHAAEECFQQAITVARRQGAKSFELRAGVSLARSWQRRGETKAAHRMLSEISGRFTEGFETKDWLEAKALLSDSTTDRSAEG